MIPLESMSAWEALKEASGNEAVVIFKHSITCGISGAAHGRVRQGETQKVIPEVHVVIVQTHRDISQQIASDLGVIHQSPQIIIMRDGKAVFDASHFAIEAETIADHLP